MEKDINEIISKSLARKELEREEHQKMNAWMRKKDNECFYRMLESYCLQAKEAVSDRYMDVDEAYQKHLNKLKQTRSTKRMLLFKRILPYAASILLMAGLFLLMMYLEHEDTGTLQEEQWLVAIEPGSQKAELILADGKVLDLNDKQKKIEIKEKDGTLISNTGTSLIYNKNESIAKTEVNYNSLVIPRGAEYQLELEDGTRVWMNSESRLRYPTQFSAEKRIVLLEGEAYFEVSKNQNRPFIVKTQGVDVKVLGTSFNISSYSDEDNICTTLVEGSVVVMDSKEQVKNLILQPGYQAVYSKSKKELKAEKVNVDLYTSWKDGKFVFEQSSLSDIMNRVSRWYDVKVFYQTNEVANINFTGSLKRYENLERLLGIIEKTNEVNFVIGENTIVVEKVYLK